MYLCVLFEYDHLFLCFLLHWLFGVITFTQKVSYHVRTIASDVITDAKSFQNLMVNNIAFFNNSHQKAMK